MPEINYEKLFKECKVPKSLPKSYKIAKPLRHDIKRLFHELYQKVQLFRTLDPSFDDELKKMHLLEPIDYIAKTYATRREGDK